MARHKVVESGDWVEVRDLAEILTTLDGAGSLDGLIFMPEMARECGRKLQATAVMEKTCGGGGMKAVNGTPLILLGDLRCDGEFHGGCDRLCTLLWKESWLRRAEAPAEVPPSGLGRSAGPWPYTTRQTDGTYRCQATSLYTATHPISIPAKIRRGLADVLTGEMGVRPFLRIYGQRFVYHAKSLIKRGGRLREKKTVTPAEALDLHPGEWVEVRSWSEIVATLDSGQRNRGMLFTRYMTPFCGGRYRVKRRMERYIDGQSGVMRTFANTVVLEGISCGGETPAGICRRAEPFYWREVWLRRVDGPSRTAP